MIQQQKLLVRGKARPITTILAGGQVFSLEGRFIRTAALRPGRSEWLEDVEEPDQIIHELKRSPVRVDILRFWQRVPNSAPKFPYYHEQRVVAALPISTWDNWWAKQINGKTRNMIRKAEKLGVNCEEVELTDTFVNGVMDIYNDSPIRRGKRFWHFGKNFESVRADLSLDTDAAIFIGAYCNGELLGFVKLLHNGTSAMITLILDKISVRDRPVMNSLISQAVSSCAKRSIKHLTYTLWRRGDHGSFQARNGFIPTPIPEYFVPLSYRGAAALRLRIHRGGTALMPKGLYEILLRLRTSWYKLTLKAPAHE